MALLKAIEATEKAVTIMKHCQTPDEIRAGFLQIAELMSDQPGQEDFVKTMRDAANYLFEDRLFEVRQTIIDELSKQAEDSRKLLQKIKKKWWQFWK